MPDFRVSSGRKITYELTYPDDPSRPTILLANPLTTPYPAWSHVVDRLHAEGFRALLFNHPGHGGSDVPRDLTSTTFDSMAIDMYDLFVSPAVAPLLSPSSPSSSPTGGSRTPPLLYAWVGVSLGAALGVVFATRYPGTVQRLIICDTISCSPINASIDDEFGPRVSRARLEGTLDTMMPETLKRWCGDKWLAAHADKAARLRALMTQTTVDGFEACCAALRSNTFDLRPLFGLVAEAVEQAGVVVGEKDGDLPQQMELMREAIQKGFDKRTDGLREVPMFVIPGAGHASFIDGYEEYTRVVLKMLK